MPGHRAMATWPWVDYKVLGFHVSASPLKPRLYTFTNAGLNAATEAAIPTKAATTDFDLRIRGLAVGALASPGRELRLRAEGVGHVVMCACSSMWTSVWISVTMEGAVILADISRSAHRRW
jgi:hypothetical protein